MKTTEIYNKLNREDKIRYDMLDSLYSKQLHAMEDKLCPINIVRDPVIGNVHRRTPTREFLLYLRERF